MRAAFWVLLALGVVAGPALAQNTAQNRPPGASPSPVGEWRVADGTAVIRVVDCGTTLWGVVAWERKPGRDVHNPDRALRRRPTLGMPILLHMRPGDEPDRWEGEIYNAEDGQTYDAAIVLRGAGTLHVEGCLLGIFCGGEDWTRVREPAARTPAADICSAIARIPGRPH